MNSTQLPNFPILKEMLLLEGFDDSGENVVAGMRQVLGDITTGWRSAYNDVEREHKRAVKKLAPEQLSKINNAANTALDKLLNDVKVEVDIAPMMDILRSKDEVKAAYTTFTILSAGAAEIHKQFMQHAISEKYGENGEVTRQPLFDKATGDKMIADVKNGSVKNIGPNTIKFIADHKTFFKQVLKINNQTITFNIDAGAQLLESKLGQTKDLGGGSPGQKEAVLGVFYMLLMLRKQLGDAATRINAAASSKKLPDETPAGKTKPAPQAPKPPVTPKP
jgi:hypothetical protein